MEKYLCVFSTDAIFNLGKSQDTLDGETAAKDGSELPVGSL